MNSKTATMGSPVSTVITNRKKKHLSSVLISKGYPSSIEQKLTKTARATATQNPHRNLNQLLFHPISKVYLRFLAAAYNHKAYTLFKSDTTLKTYLVWPKDTLEPTKQDGVVYKIPSECGKVCIGETGRAMQERIKENNRDIWLARTQTSKISEHANKMGISSFGTKSSLLIVSLTGTHEGSRKQSI